MPQTLPFQRAHCTSILKTRWSSSKIVTVNCITNSNHRGHLCLWKAVGTLFFFREPCFERVNLFSLFGFCFTLWRLKAACWPSVMYFLVQYCPDCNKTVWIIVVIESARPLLNDDTRTVAHRFSLQSVRQSWEFRQVWSLTQFSPVSHFKNVCAIVFL